MWRTVGATCSSGKGQETLPTSKNHLALGLSRPLVRSGSGASELQCRADPLETTAATRLWLAKQCRASSGSWLDLLQASAGVGHHVSGKSAGSWSHPRFRHALDSVAQRAHCQGSGPTQAPTETRRAPVGRRAGRVPTGWVRDGPFRPSRCLLCISLHTCRLGHARSTDSVTNPGVLGPATMHGQITARG